MDASIPSIRGIKCSHVVQPEAPSSYGEHLASRPFSRWQVRYFATCTSAPGNLCSVGLPISTAATLRLLMRPRGAEWSRVVWEPPQVRRESFQYKCTPKHGWNKHPFCQTTQRAVTTTNDLQLFNLQSNQVQHSCTAIRRISKWRFVFSPAMIYYAYKKARALSVNEKEIKPKRNW